MTIEDGLQVIQGVTFSNTFIEKALLKYNITPGTPYFAVPVRERELAEALMYEFAANNLVNGGAYKKKIGDRSISTDGRHFTNEDRNRWLNMASSLRVRWGEKSNVISNRNIIRDYSKLW